MILRTCGVISYFIAKYAKALTKSIEVNEYEVNEE